MKPTLYYIEWSDKTDPYDNGTIIPFRSYQEAKAFAEKKFPEERYQYDIETLKDEEWPLEIYTGE